MRSMKRILLGFEDSGSVPILDDLGIADSLQLGFANIRLLNSYEDFAYLIYRQDDAEEAYFYFEDDGTLDTNAILTWLDGSIGKVKKWGNQGNPSYPAYQDDPDKMPICAASGSWYDDGIYFDGVDDFLEIDMYVAMQFTLPEVTTYLSFNAYDTSGSLFAINTGSTSASQMNLVLNYGLSTIYCIMAGGIRHDTPVSANFNGGSNTSIFDWSSNTVTMKCNSSVLDGTYAGPVSTRDTIHIACRDDETSGEAALCECNIKSLLHFNETCYDKYDTFVSNGL